MPEPVRRGLMRTAWLNDELPQSFQLQGRLVADRPFSA
jgi:hypothetical protein